MQRLTCWLAIVLVGRIVLSGMLLQPVSQQNPPDELLRGGFTYRNLGPFRVGGWISDIAVPETPEKAHLFAIGSKARCREGALGNYRLYGDRLAVTPNEPNGMTFTFYLKEAPKEPKDKATLRVTDVTGKTVRTLEPAAKAGLNRIFWDLSEGGRGAAPGGEFRPGAGLRTVPAGEYSVTLQVGEKKLTQPARVLAARSGE